MNAFLKIFSLIILHKIEKSNKHQINSGGELRVIRAEANAAFALDPGV